MHLSHLIASTRLVRALVLFSFLSVLGMYSSATNSSTSDPDLVGLIDNVLEGVGEVVTESLESLLVHDVEGLPVKEYGLALIERIDQVLVETRRLLVNFFDHLSDEHFDACNILMIGVDLDSLRDEYIALFGVDGMRDPDFDRRKIYLILGELSLAHDSCARFLDALEGVDEE